MPASLLDMNISENQSAEVIIVEFVPQEGDAATWDTHLKVLAKSGKRVIFRVNYMDPDGMAFILMRHWLQYTPTHTILIDTSIPGIQKALKLALKERVTFIDSTI